jgi:two-component system LytT family sensor kinase
MFIRLIQYNRMERREESEALEVERAINYFSNSMIGQNTVDEILWDITKNCISRLSFEDCVIYMLDEDRKVFIQKAAYGPKNPKNYEISSPIEIPIGTGIVGTVGLTGIAEIIEDTSKDERYIIDDDRRFSEITVPIIHQGKVIGIIDSEHHQKHFFRDKHLRILSTIASLCANKIIKLRLETAYRNAEMKLNENSRKIAESKLSTLRMQMNPHFIFNSLNSINNFIAKNDTIRASGYLSKFSKFVRLIFDNAQSEWITLDKELKALELYVELEKIRFGDKFQVMIDVSRDINPANVMMPNLLIQPFVENAIWHGLLQKPDGTGELFIRYWQVKDKIHVSVEDNGIGRTASGELKLGRVSTHEKKGLKITEERIRIMNEMYDSDIHYYLTDLYDDAGFAAGTRAIVSLSMKALHD